MHELDEINADGQTPKHRTCSYASGGQQNVAVPTTIELRAASVPRTEVLRCHHRMPI